VVRPAQLAPSLSRIRIVVTLSEPRFRVGEAGHQGAGLWIGPAAPGVAARGGGYSNTRGSCWGEAVLQVGPHSGPLGMIVW
jgi:hypothetical protein